MRFAADRLSCDNRLIYIARVTEIQEDAEYYDEPQYWHRLLVGV